MVKHFYSFVVETETLFLEIDSLEISDHEKEHLKTLAESHIHHSVIDTVLSELQGDDKKQFIAHLNTKNHEDLWKFLHSKISDVEDKIKIAARVIHHELLNDLKEAKSHKN